MNSLNNASKAKKENQKLIDKVFYLECLLQKQSSCIANKERREIIRRLVKILEIIDPYHEYEKFFPNHDSIKNTDIVEILDNFILILKDHMFDFDNNENELFELLEQEFHGE